ncbi:MAG: hypothetical protein P8P74_18730 [Crocinitomicaceae bacterium]|nr:hypothetical protein [Crocinitomicaceae bacterium]
MKRFLAVFCITLSSFGFGQDAWIFPKTSNLLCFDHEVPFYFLSLDSVESFQFELFNRWGELIATSRDFDFALEEILVVEKETVIEGAYVGRVRIKMTGKQEQEHFINFTFLPYCNCG